MNMEALKRELLEGIAAKMHKQCQLVAVLQYYDWLEQHGLSWDQIRGVRKLRNNARNRRKFHDTCRRLGREQLIRQYDYAPYILRQARSGEGRPMWEPVPDGYTGSEPVQYRYEPYQGPFVSYKLVDASEAVLPYPPYEDDVIYARV